MLNIPKFSLYNYYYAKHCSWHKPGNRRTKGEIKEDIVFAHWLSTEVQTLGSLWCARVMCRISNLYGGRLVSKLHHHTLPHSGMVPSFRYAIFIQVCYISSFRHAIYLHSGIIFIQACYLHSGMVPSLIEVLYFHADVWSCGWRYILRGFEFNINIISDEWFVKRQQYNNF